MAQLSLPFVALHPLAGRPISVGINLWNIWNGKDYIKNGVELGIPESDIIYDPRIRERVSQKLSREEKNIDPCRIVYKQLFREDQFYARHYCSSESGWEMYERMHDSIGHNLNEYGSPETLTVFVSHSIAMQNYFKGLFFQENNEITAEFRQHHIKTCEMFLLERTPSKISSEKRFRAD